MNAEIQNLTDKLPKIDNPTERLGLLIKIQKKCLKNKLYDYCEKYAYESLDLSKAIGDKEKELISLNSISMIKYFYAEYDNSMELFLKLLKKAEEYKDKIMIPRALEYIGRINFNLERIDIALKYLLLSIEKRKEFNIKGLELAYTMNSIGIAYFKQKKYKEGQQTFINALNIAKEHKDEDLISSIYDNLGNIYKEKGEFDIALDYYEKSLEMDEVLNDVRGIASSLCNMGRLYSLRGEFGKAVETQKNALKFAEKMEDVIMLKDIYKEIADTYDETGNIKEAFKFYKLYMKLKEKILNKESLDKIAKIESRFELKKKEQEKELYRLKNVELQKAYDEIEKNKEELRDKNEKLIKTGNLKDLILTVLSTDIKEVINLLKTTTEVMSDNNNIKGETREHLEFIFLSIEKTSVLMKDIMLLDEINSFDYDLKLSLYCLQDVIKTFSEKLKNTAKKKGIKVEIEYSENKLYCKIDTMRFWQIVEKIVNNSLKYCKKGSVIKIIVRDIDKREPYITERDMFIQLDIVNNCEYMDKEKILHFREDISSNDIRMSIKKGIYNIGLTIAKRLIELHNGFIDITTEKERGSKFSIYIPRENTFS